MHKEKHMQPIKKVLLAGTTQAPYHPIESLADRLPAILGDNFDVVTTTCGNDLLELSQFDVCVLYVDLWKQQVPVSPEQAGALLSFVAKGGGLLVVHGGISIQLKSELADLMGARFVEHPPLQNILVSPTLDHPIVAGVDSFMVFEEPFQLEFSPLSEIEIFLEYTMDGVRYPAGWSRRFGLGRVAFTMPGHTAESFEIPSYRTILRNAVDWVADK
jgi:type 1 glutamine amidotransferase